MVKIAIIHFAPVELYPPVQNLLIALAAQENSKKIVVLTTHNFTAGLRPFEVNSENINIIRIGKFGRHLNSVTRAWNYFIFYSSCLLVLIGRWPKRILYFEALSSYPAYLFKRFFKNDCEIFIHYHEYVSLDEYRNGMSLIRYFHVREKKLYPEACWISQTNQHRMDLFKEDHAGVLLPNMFILPNYPPKKWFNRPKEIVNIPIRIVYTGALSLTSMYTKEFAEWVQEQKGNVTWDIYSYNYAEQAKEYLLSLKSDWIRLKEGIDYASLPVALKDYDVGVILYTGHIPNYIYNAPNKLFEYVICGLDVWFPAVMLGSMPYKTSATYPKIIPVDFTKLNHLDLREVVERTGYFYKPLPFYCEEALKTIIAKLS